MFIRSAKELALLVMSRRRELGLSQAEVADKVGLKQKSISAFENKPESTKIETLFRILSAVKLDINGLAKEKANADDKSWREEW
jgi:HTH-type transcriptional regulator/antitoxin HipB